MSRGTGQLILGVVATALLGGALTGCGGSSTSASASPSAGTTTASPTASTSAAAAFNPCSSLDAKRISKVLGAKVTVNSGTASTPRCALLPVTKGDPTFELSYLWFDGGLDAAWKTMTDKPAGTVTEPTVPGADAAKLIVQRGKSAYADSAFLQNGSLIQSLNGIALAPYNPKAMQRATAEILKELSAGAAQQ